MEYGIHLFTPQISLQQLKLSVSYVIIPSEARFINLSHTQLASHVLIAQQGRNSSCEYFYRSLGCRQLTSSSCDVRVHFRVARQCYFKYESNPVGHYHVLFKLKCISLRLLPSKRPCFSWKSVPLNSYVTLGETKNELVCSLPINVVDWSNQRLVSAPYIHPPLTSRVN